MTYLCQAHRHLIEHNILNHEINDDGYRYQRINFRTVYDTLILCTSTLYSSTIETHHQRTLRKQVC